VNSTEGVSPLARLADGLVRLGGGRPCELNEDAERSSYLGGGVLVAATAVSAGALVCFVSGLAGAPAVLAGVLGTAAGLLVAALGRMLATAPADPGAGRAHRVLGDAGRVLVALVLGAVLGELAALAVFAGAIDRELAAAPAAARAAVVRDAEVARPDGPRAERAALDTAVASALDRRDRALVVARCEYRPSPGCPSTTITGDPGRGPETAEAEAALAAAERDLTEATTRRDAAAPGLDARIAQLRTRVDADASAAAASAAADTGLDARWAAMNAVTARAGGPLALRVAVDLLFALLCALPLVARLWRGESDQDRRLRARRVRARAEEEADTAIAVHRARDRMVRELGHDPGPAVAGTLRTAASGPAGDRPIADRPIGDRRTPPELPPTPARLAELAPSSELASSTELVPSTERASTELARAPGAGSTLAPVAEPAPLAKGPLDLLPGPLPGAVRAVSGLVRPLVPRPLARLAATGPRTVRVARGLWEEVDELQVTVRQRRSVRMADDEYHEAAPAGQPADEPAGLPAEQPDPPDAGPLRATAEVVSRPAPEQPSEELGGARRGLAARRRELRRRPRELHRAPRELPGPER
jgi:hypothetical protein